MKISLQKSDKTLITNQLNQLRKFNFKVYNFNYKKALPEGIKHFVDHVLISDNYIIFAEVKIGKDKLSKAQANLQTVLLHHSHFNPSVFHILIQNITEAKQLVDLLITNKFKGVQYDKEIHSED